jgi:hypothetical protein
MTGVDRHRDAEVDAHPVDIECSKPGELERDAVFADRQLSEAVDALLVGKCSARAPNH